MGSEYRIGTFADMGGVSAKTLRFYDEIGLLRPTRVDPRTRYRFYLPEQLTELAAIIELKDAGASLTEIGRLKKTRGLENTWRQVLHELLRSLPEPAVGDLRGVLWHRCADSGFLEGEPFVALRQRVPPRACYELGQLPAATLACAYSTMDDDSAAKTYKALLSWTQARGYRLVGPKREISHDKVLEIHFPVASV